MMKRVTIRTEGSMRNQSGVHNQLARKLRGIAKSEKAETITEVLVAMLIAGLAILMLATVIATAFNVLNNSRQSMETYYETGNQLADPSSSGELGSSGAIVVHELNNGVSGAAISLSGEVVDAGISVNAYEGGTDSNKPVVSYEVKPESGGTP